MGKIGKVDKVDTARKSLSRVSFGMLFWVLAQVQVSGTGAGAGSGSGSAKSQIAETFR